MGLVKLAGYIKKKPLVKKLFTPKAALPKAERGAYSVLLADLTGDREHQMVENIANSLDDLEGVHTARLSCPLAGAADTLKGQAIPA